MTLPKLMLVPDSDGYSSTDGTEVIATALDGGAARYRQDKIGATKQVGVQWTMNPQQYQYWRAFFATIVKKGALPFRCDLVSEDAFGPAEHVCSFVPGSISLPMQQGFTYVQRAQLEVTPLPRDAELDLAVIALFEGAPDVDSVLIADLAHLVNVDAPEALGA